ncbi:MAG: MarR family transcriptional regulator [Candidatus Hydrogenedentes bacterium]|nr:MarR family transcriptional regulator [Candidatus Hydrogenedentota bacterium]
MTPLQRDLTEIMRDEMIMRDEITKLLTSEPHTVPEIAEALKVPTTEALLWLTAMRRYGLVEEVGRADANGYFKYTLVKEEN